MINMNKSYSELLNQIDSEFKKSIDIHFRTYIQLLNRALLEFIDIYSVTKEEINLYTEHLVHTGTQYEEIRYKGKTIIFIVKKPDSILIFKLW